MTDEKGIVLSNSTFDANLLSVVIPVRIHNKSRKDCKNGTVALQDGDSGDNQQANFGFIRGNGGEAEQTVLMRGYPDTIAVQFNAADGSEWKGIKLYPNLDVVDINLND